MILLMKRKVDLRSLEEVRSVILAHHINRKSMGTLMSIVELKILYHVTLYTTFTLPCTLHDPVPGGQVQPLLCNGPSETYCRSTISHTIMTLSVVYPTETIKILLLGCAARV